MPITVLDQNTINKIAAGEVIERPASVVKELLENAIDAQATAVTVEIKEGGCELIRVTDNGCGISADQIPLAFLRHATSKIRTVEDLLSVSSLGFRGEALASIASVSQVELISKTPQSLTGSRYQIEGGRERGMEEIGAPEGTTIIARNLFYNTPARKKFLKTPPTEGSHVASLVEKIALSRPDISIRFIQNNQNKLYTSGNSNVKDLIYTVFGRETAASLIGIDWKGDGISITGYIGKPVLARSTRGYENYFINGRYIKNQIVARAIEEAYKPFMMQHKYPFTMLYFAIDPQSLDVNVHPTKMELRFSDAERVYKAVLDCLHQALSQEELIPTVELGENRRENDAVPSKGMQSAGRSPRPEPFEIRRRQAMAGETGADAAQKDGLYRQAPPARPSLVEDLVPKWLREERAQKGQTEETPAGAQPAGEKPEGEPQESQSPKTAAPAAEQLDLFEEKLLDPKSRSRHKLIGQLFDTYWLVEFEEKLFIIDQHAAHEKVLFEHTMDMLKNREFGTQMVDPPIILTVSPGEELLLKKYMHYFADMGFQIEAFGGKEYAVRGVPANLPSLARKDLLLEMLDGLSEDTALGSPDMIWDKVASMSCKAAVKGRHAMSPAEADALIGQLLSLENPYACPHGRPTIISMSRYELEKKFKRIV